MSTTSFWLKEPHDGLPRSRFEGRADVAVIGGGVTGCSCALTLAERGVRVRLYERREIAGGASGRNGGFALRGAAMPYDEARRALGDERARLVMTLTERALDRLEELAGDAFRRVGSLRLAADDEERDALRREHDALRQDGFAVEWVEDLEPPLDRLYRGAILHPDDGALYPARWVRRLAEHAARAGADVREGEATTVEDVEADAVVVACDGYTRALLPELPVQPTRGQVVATEPLRERLYERPHYARGGYDYWQQLPDGRLVLGGNRDVSLETENTDVEETTRSGPGGPRRARRAARSATGRGSPTAGPASGAPRPIASRSSGEVRDGVWVAGGYSGHGNALGLACGDLVARAVLGEAPPELDVFAPARLTTA